VRDLMAHVQQQANQLRELQVRRQQCRTDDRCKVAATY
jgi:hypothetical protein